MRFQTRYQSKLAGQTIWRINYEMKKQLLLGHLLPLLIGGLIYILFRTESLVMFKWFTFINIDHPIELLRETTIPIMENFPSWFIYSFPDALWIFSYMSITLLIWRNEINKQNYFWIFIMPIISILSEVGQLLNIIPGTFDFIDLFFYVLGFISPLLIFTNHIANKKTNKS